MVVHTSVILHLITKSYLTTVRGIPPTTGSNKLWGVSVPLLYWGSHTFFLNCTLIGTRCSSLSCIFMETNSTQTHQQHIPNSNGFYYSSVNRASSLVLYFNCGCTPLLKYTPFAAADVVLSALREVSQAEDGSRTAARPQSDLSQRQQKGAFLLGKHLSSTDAT